MKKDSDIDLGLKQDNGLNEKNVTELSEEEKQIVLSEGRSYSKTTERESTIYGVANYRVLSNNQ